MKYYELGKENQQTFLLLPGTFCTVKSNFSQVIPFLAKEFHVIGVDYDGFDGKETEFTDMITITQKIENFIQKQFHGKIDIAYGSSLGGSSVSLLIQRRNIHIDHVVIGSSDFDQNGKLSAWLKTQLVSALMYPILKSGDMPDWMTSVMKKRHGEEAVEKSEKMISVISTGMKNVSKKTVKNQFYSDLITKIDDNISVSETTVHIFYALQMGEQYRERYVQHFRNPDIIEQDYGHEELLFYPPELWIKELHQHVIDRQRKG